MTGRAPNTRMCAVESFFVALWHASRATQSVCETPGQLRELLYRRGWRTRGRTVGRCALECAATALNLCIHITVAPFAHCTTVGSLRAREHVALAVDFRTARYTVMPA